MFSSLKNCVLGSRKLCFCTAITVLSLAQAQTIDVQQVRFAGPYAVQEPVVIDSVTLAGKKYSPQIALDQPVNILATKGKSLAAIPQNQPEGSLCLASFTVNTSAYSKLTVKVDGPKLSKVFIGGTEGTSRQVTPGSYEVVVKYVADTAQVKLSVSSDKAEALSLVENTSLHPLSLTENMELKFVSPLSLSPSGRYYMSGSYYLASNNKSVWQTRITDRTTGRVVSANAAGCKWMPNSDRYYKVVTEHGVRHIDVTDPATGHVTRIASGVPEESFVMSPTEDYLIYNIYAEGPKKQSGVYEVVHPDDRQPGYRGRNQLGIFRFGTNQGQQITYGWHNTNVEDISHDGKKILFAISQDSVTTRPSSLQTVYLLDLNTMKAREVIRREGFISGVQFYPNSTTKAVVKGTAEAFGGIGRNLPDDMTPSMYNYEMFALDLNTLEATPLTKTFNPSIDNIETLAADGNIYFTAENADSVSLYRMLPASGKIERIDQPIEVISSFTFASKAPVMMVAGSSAVVPSRAYSITLDKKRKIELVEDPNAELMSELQLGECLAFSAPTSRGYNVTGHYYLPANFDESKSYPVIVSYYGGCSPTARNFGRSSHYPAHYWNALGFVVLVLNPSGASGFGQEWAARHVNTAGEGVAEDIIEATKYFADNNKWVNKGKIGCISASYGGFMTQCLLSKTDLFACGVSHAGISDHSSYWGEGYWGYSYSQVSMANTYPWTRKDLYVDRSPLYNADKIKQPLLFTHGTADTNVPVGESIQMYTALKILGVPTAMIFVEGENHGIMDYGKRVKWINSICAWFKRWLQDDDTWWNGIYPEVKQ